MLSDQSRFYYPFPNADTVSQINANLNHVQERFDRLPIFEPKIVQQYSGSTSTNSGSFVADTTLFAPFEFRKEESWTDLKVTVHSTFYKNNVAGVGAVSVSVDGVADATTGNGVARLFFNTPAVHLQLSGIARLSGRFAAGKHTIGLSWACSTAGVQCDSNDWQSIEIVECLPATY